MLHFIRTNWYPPSCPKESAPLRFGILGAARIGDQGLVRPAESHPDVLVTALASSASGRGSRYANFRGITRFYSGPFCYQELIDDPDVDVVYIALPNSSHFEWSMRAIAAGKHVLVEKPIACLADEARQIFEFAKRKGVVVLEGIALTFHPAMQRVKSIIDSGSLGKVINIKVEATVPELMTFMVFREHDIRFQYSLGGGCTMDMGVLPLEAIQFLMGDNFVNPDITLAKAVVSRLDSRVDRNMHVAFTMPSAVTGEIYIDFAMRGWGPFGLLPNNPKSSITIKLEGGEIEFQGFGFVDVGHEIKLKPRVREHTTEQIWTHPDGPGQTWWSSYRYRLEAFVDKVRGRTPQYWPDPSTSISRMEIIGRIYESAGLPPRVTSSYTHKEDDSADM